ncbi:alpha/beta hydrolase [Mesorhizobium australicum]|uniref:alpha/beta fold hydrolase n=1 Tax=Mesorhizobium australicum TaxID=536018 RepID=UPI00333D6C1C
MLEHFQSIDVDIEDAGIFVRRAGAGPAVLLLHGFPQTHLMWRDIAPLLADRFTVICADLRGYGRSACPASSADHAPYAKRAMASEMVAMMAKLGFTSFMVAGHDRGGRVAYRMALDHPDRIEKLAVLDIVPTADAWDRADARLALGFWPWSLLAQPEPLPENILAGAADAIVDNALGGWGSSPDVFPAGIRQAYVEALRDPARIHAICEEYRAAATLDRDHDRADKAAGRRIACPVLALWSGQGALAEWYAGEGGPLALWRNWADDVRGRAMSGGHFFPEEAPAQTAGALIDFFGGLKSGTG